MTVLTQGRERETNEVSSFEFFDVLGLCQAKVTTCIGLLELVFMCPEVRAETEVAIEEAVVQLDKLRFDLGTIARLAKEDSSLSAGGTVELPSSGLEEPQGSATQGEDSPPW